MNARFGIAVVLVWLGSAWAPSAWATLVNENCPLGTDYTDNCTSDQPGSSGGNTSESLKESVTVNSTEISKRVQFGFRGGQQGGQEGNVMLDRRGLTRSMSAGDPDGRWGAWASYSRSSFEDDLSSTAYDADMDTVLAGVDYRLDDRTIVGAAVGYENNDVTTRFNFGEQDVTGWTIAPYLGYSFSPSFSADLSAGYTRVDIDQFRRLTPAGARISGSTNSDRWYVAGNLNGFTSRGNWLFSGRAGLLWARDEVDGFTESGAGIVRNIASDTVNLTQGRVGGDVAYSMGEWEPYVSAMLEHDFNSEDVTVAPGQAQPSNDDTGYVLGFGIRYFGNSGWSGNLEWTTTEGRDNFDADTVSITLRAQF